MDQDLPIEPPQEDPAPSFNPVEIVLYGVARFYPWILFAAAVGACVGLAQSLQQPNTYASSGKFMARLGARESVTPEGAIMGIESGGKAVSEIGNVIQVLKQPVVFERLAKELGPERLLEPFDPTAHDDDGVPWYTHWLHEKQKELFFPDQTKVVDPENQTLLDAAARKAQLCSVIRGDPTSRMISIAFKATSPSLAEDGAKLLMKECQDHHREFWSGQLQQDFIDQQLETARAAARAADERWADHVRQCGFFDIATAKKDVVTRLAQMDQNERDSQHDLETYDAQIGDLEKQMAALESKIELPVAELTGPNPVLAQIQTEIDATNTEIAQLGLIFQTDSEPYKLKRGQLDKHLARLQDRLAATEPTVVTQPAGTKMVDNPPYKALQEKRTEIKGKKHDLEIDLAVRQSSAKLERQRLEDRLEAIRACEPIHEKMTEDRKQADSLVAQLTKSRDDAQRLSMLDASDQMSNLVVVQEPRYTPNKVGPERLKLITKGLGVGAGVGVALCLLRQLLDPKLRYPGSVQRVLGLKVLGVIPETKSWRKAGKKARRRLAV